MKKITKDILSIALSGVSAAVKRAEEIVELEIPKEDEAEEEPATDETPEEDLDIPRETDED